MPLLSAAISESPTGSQAIDRRATKKSSIVVCRRENTSDRRQRGEIADTITASIAVNAVCISGDNRMIDLN